MPGTSTGIEQYYNLINRTKCILPKQQRGLIVKQILEKGPVCNVLVWGVGGDSIIWHTVNQGHTLFIEHDQRWADRIAAQIKDIRINVYQYQTTCRPTLPIHKQPDIDVAELNSHPLPQGIEGVDWDVVLIDGPTGFDDSCPGRMLPIYWTSKLIDPTRCDIFIDDYSRPIEFTYSNRFLFHRYNRFRVFDERLKLLWLKATPGAR